VVEEQKRLLQTKATELDTQCTALHAANLELRDARASNKALEDNLEHAQDELSQSLWMGHIFILPLPLMSLAGEAVAMIVTQMILK
jgi:hypothetical protein